MNEDKGIPAIWINPDTLQHIPCYIIGKITEYSSLLDFGDYQREVENWEFFEDDGV